MYICGLTAVIRPMCYVMLCYESLSYSLLCSLVIRYFGEAVLRPVTCCARGQLPPNCPLCWVPFVTPLHVVFFHQRRPVTLTPCNYIARLYHCIGVSSRTSVCVFVCPRAYRRNYYYFLIRTRQHNKNSTFTQNTKNTIMYTKNSNLRQQTTEFEPNDVFQPRY